MIKVVEKKIISMPKLKIVYTEASELMHDVNMRNSVRIVHSLEKTHQFDRFARPKHSQMG
jgi:hypothetical protein